MNQHVIIDGYNVIHAVPSFKKTMLHDAHSARELLIHSVGRWALRTSTRVSIIFDGDAPAVKSAPSLHAPVHVVYAFPLSADAKIRSIIEHAQQRRSLIVISSDREILRFAQTCSCETHTSRHFANLLSSSEDIIPDKSETSLTPQQINEWLKIFGEK